MRLDFDFRAALGTGTIACLLVESEHKVSSHKDLETLRILIVSSGGDTVSASTTRETRVAGRVEVHANSDVQPSSPTGSDQPASCLQPAQQQQRSIPQLFNSARARNDGGKLRASASAE
jgi:hypothetical protein